MEAIKTIKFKERPIDLSILYHRITELEQVVLGLSAKVPTLKVRTSEGIEIIPFDQIIRCQSDSNYSMIILKNGGKVCTSKTLKFIQSQLKTGDFIRVHASHLVALNEVRKISTLQGKTLILSNGDGIPVSRTYQEEVNKAFE